MAQGALALPHVSFELSDLDHVRLLRVQETLLRGDRAPAALSDVALAAMRLGLQRAVYVGVGMDELELHLAEEHS